MRFELTPRTDIEVRKGMQSASKAWSTIAFEYIGAKNPDLARIANELETDGVSEWEGFTLFHPSYE